MMFIGKALANSAQKSMDKEFEAARKGLPPLPPAPQVMEDPPSQPRQAPNPELMNRLFQEAMKDLSPDKYRDARLKFEKIIIIADQCQDYRFLAQSLEKAAETLKIEGDWLKAALFLNSAMAVARKLSSFDESYYFNALARLEADYIKKVSNKEINQAVLVTAIKQRRQTIMEARLKASQKIQLRDPEIRKRATKSSSIMKDAALSTAIEAKYILDAYSRECIDILSSLCAECEKDLGEPPPCSYAVGVGGSASKRQMCLYSDIEPVIITQKDPKSSQKDKQPGWFDRFALLLAIKLASFGESEHDCLPGETGKPAEKSPIKGGFQLDTKFHVRSYIGTPEFLVRKQQGDEMFVGDNIAPFLIFFSLEYVAGDKKLVKEYETTLHKFLDEPMPGTPKKKRREHRGEIIINALMESFGSKLAKKKPEESFFGVKDEFYRPLDMFVGGLAYYYGITGKLFSERTFAIREKKIFNLAWCAQLDNMFEDALDLRLKANLFYASEDDGIFIQTPKTLRRKYVASETERRIIDKLLKFNASLSQCLTQFLQNTAEPGKARSNLTVKMFDNLGRSEYSVAKELNQKAHLLMNQGNYKEAREKNNQALALYPEDKHLRFRDVRLLEIEGQSGLARMKLEKLDSEMKADFNDFELLFAAKKCLIKLYLLIKDYAKAEAKVNELQAIIFKRKSPQSVEHADALCMQARVLQGDNRLQESFPLFQKSMEILSSLKHFDSMEFFECVLYAGMVARQLKMYEVAVKLHEGLITLMQHCKNYSVKGRVELFIELKNDCEAVNKFDKAQEYAETALKLAQTHTDKPTVALTHNLIGLHYLNMRKDCVEAAKYFELAIELEKSFPNHPDIRQYRENLRIAKGEKKADDIISGVVSLAEVPKVLSSLTLSVYDSDAKQTIARNLCDFLLAQTSMDEQLAALMDSAITKIKGIATDDWEPLVLLIDRYGSVLMHLGRFQEAISRKNHCIYCVKKQADTLLTISTYERIVREWLSYERFQEAIGLLTGDMSAAEFFVGKFANTRSILSHAPQIESLRRELQSQRRESWLPVVSVLCMLQLLCYVKMKELPPVAELVDKIELMLEEEQTLPVRNKVILLEEVSKVIGTIDSDRAYRLLRLALKFNQNSDEKLRILAIMQSLQSSEKGVTEALILEEANIDLSELKIEELSSRLSSVAMWSDLLPKQGPFQTAPGESKLIESGMAATMPLTVAKAAAVLAPAVAGSSKGQARSSQGKPLPPTPKK